jgi:hypothetical protein
MTTNEAIAKYEAVIQTALNKLSSRATYQRAVITGDQRWSGADLRGKAKRFGYQYAQARKIAKSALREAGGDIISIEHGLRSTAVLINETAEKHLVYMTPRGLRIREYGAALANVKGSV